MSQQQPVGEVPALGRAQALGVLLEVAARVERAALREHVQDRVASIRGGRQLGLGPALQQGAGRLREVVAASDQIVLLVRVGVQVEEPGARGILPRFVSALGGRTNKRVARRLRSGVMTNWAFLLPIGARTEARAGLCR